MSSGQGNNIVGSCVHGAQDIPAPAHIGRAWSLWDIMQQFDVEGLVIRLFRIELWICRCKRKDPVVVERYESDSNTSQCGQHKASPTRGSAPSATSVNSCILTDPSNSSHFGHFAMYYFVGL